MNNNLSDNEAKAVAKSSFNFSGKVRDVSQINKSSFAMIDHSKSDANLMSANSENPQSKKNKA